MRILSISDAKSNLSRLVDEVNAGEELVITKAGKPVARLVPFIPVSPARKPGFLKGKIRIAGDFNAPLPNNVLDTFEDE